MNLNFVQQIQKENSLTVAAHLIQSENQDLVNVNQVVMVNQENVKKMNLSQHQFQIFQKIHLRNVIQIFHLPCSASLQSSIAPRLKAALQ